LFVNGDPGKLKAEVLDKGLCTGCGACASLCPYIYAEAEKVAVIYDCGLKEGNCYRVCPRTPTDLETMDRFVFGTIRHDHELGEHSNIYYARAAEPALVNSGQYGGTVTGILTFLIEKGDIEAAVITRGEDGKMPEPHLALTLADVISGSRSKYSACPTLAALPREGYKNLAVVGRPCQVTALRKMQILNEKPGNDRLPVAGKNILIIGLFCFWALAPTFYKFLSERTGGKKIIGLDIPVDGLSIKLEGESEILVPVDEIRQFIRPACLQCFDCTAELADFSVGSTEYDPVWNTLIVRTTRGRDVINAAVEAGALEVKPYPPERLPLLRKAAVNKKRRTIGMHSDYLLLAESYKRALDGRERGEQQ